MTISAGYGTGGSQIARLVADELDLRLLDRAISADVAAQVQITVEEAEGASFTRSRTDRFFALLAPLSAGCSAPAPMPPHQRRRTSPPKRICSEGRAEQIMRDAVATGAVILGRGGGAAFRNEPDVLRVRLFGSKPARIAHAARTQHLEPGDAEKQLARVDAARAQYVRRLYSVDINDPGLYLLQIDSTVLDEPSCARLITTAYRSLLAN